ncbi:hypothetical protein [Streptomyces sp. NPDC059564]|uniref:hypothetical protein n=1 Tax=Streptomyces sp. NPDC059564 TaxID=3346865 RepID=UPI0036878D9E
MGLKDQFQDKAKQLADRARASGEQGAGGETPEHAPELSQDIRPKTQKVRETFDDSFDK